MSFSDRSRHIGQAMIFFSFALLCVGQIPELSGVETAQDVPLAKSSPANSLRRASVVGGTCLTMSTGTPIDLFIWTEYEAQDPAFFTNLFAYMQGNCALGRLSRLIMRMTVPISMWLPTVSSPFYAFLKKLHANGIVIEMILFPYMMEAGSRKKWVAYGGATNPIDNSLIFMKQWNKLLVNSGFKNSFKGIVFDYEERAKGWANSPAIDIDAATVKRLKSTYGAFELGVTVGWDDVSKFAKYPWVDRWYMQMYDFYDKSGALGRTSRSPFILYKNDPDALVKYLLGTLFSASMQSLYKANSAKISAMWSWQSPSASTCITPNAAGCGGNSEFGIWNAPAFNIFIKKLIAASSTFAAVKHGMYHFGILPKAWLR
jgi:hypothetical protein